MWKNVTATDVAKIAGVSQSTVSRVFTPGAKVSKKKREVVLRVSEELGYKPNALARSLTTNRTNIIGVVMHNMKNPFYPEILERIYKEVRERGYQLLFINLDNETLSAGEVSQLLEYKVGGVIITDILVSSSIESLFISNGIPVVLINRYTNDTKYSVVCCDNYHGGQKIGEYLTEKGHGNVAFISGPINTSTSIDRERGFREAILKSKNVKMVSEIGQYTYQSGYDITLKLLNNQYPPLDAIFCANDIMALGSVDAAKKFGLNVPRDISIVGFDDISQSNWPSYSLTTWKQPADEMVSYAIDLIFKIINEEITNPVFKLMKGSLIERTSVSSRR